MLPISFVGVSSIVSFFSVVFKIPDGPGTGDGAVDKVIGEEGFSPEGTPSEDFERRRVGKGMMNMVGCGVRVERQL